MKNLKCNFPKILVVGVGHAGLVTTNHMIDYNFKGTEYMMVSSDPMELKLSKVTNQVNIREGFALGLGMITEECANGLAKKHSQLIKNRLKGTDIVIIISGMGGFTGTGAAHVVASCAREMGALTIAIVTFPFMFEGRQRRNRAIAGTLELKKNIDNILVLPIDNLACFKNSHLMFKNPLKEQKATPSCAA